MHGIGQNQRQHVCFIQFARRRHQSDVQRRFRLRYQVAAMGVKSAISDYIVFT